jgi:hypothetical protein
MLRSIRMEDLGDTADGHRVADFRSSPCSFVVCSTYRQTRSSGSSLRAGITCDASVGCARFG